MQARKKKKMKFLKCLKNKLNIDFCILQIGWENKDKNSSQENLSSATCTTVNTERGSLVGTKMMLGRNSDPSKGMMSPRNGKSMDEDFSFLNFFKSN